jgi:hypothetical protein
MTTNKYVAARGESMIARKKRKVVTINTGTSKLVARRKYVVVAGQN